MVQNDFRVDVVESVEIAVVDLVEMPVVDSGKYRLWIQQN